MRNEPVTLTELAYSVRGDLQDNLSILFPGVKVDVQKVEKIQGESYGTNYQKLGKELMSRDELAVMNGSKCILQLRGVRPFLSDGYTGALKAPVRCFGNHLSG